MESVCLEGEWRKLLEKQEWPRCAIKTIHFCWAKSTLSNYNRLLQKFKDFCDENGYKFPPDNSSSIADFLCYLASGSERPKSLINNAIAAINAMTRVGMMPRLCDDNISSLVCALIKTQTLNTMKKSTVLPVQPINDLLISWGENTGMSLKKLRMKCIALLALAFMLRPSDIAPKSVKYNLDTNTTERFLFTTDAVHFPENGGVSLKFLGTKNDTNRDGFSVSIPPASNAVLDPASALQCYILRSSHLRPTHSNPVFISLKSPYKALSAASIAKDLNTVIKDSGLDTTVYSAKSFRPTGATRAIEQGIDPDKVRRLGRWKTQTVFFEHYVHDKVPLSTTDSIIGVVNK